MEKDMQDFINRNRDELTAIILSICLNCEVNDDEEIEGWIMNDAGLYNWAADEGVEV